MRPKKVLSGCAADVDAGHPQDVARRDPATRRDQGRHRPGGRPGDPNDGRVDLHPVAGGQARRRRTSSPAGCAPGRPAGCHDVSAAPPGWYRPRHQHHRCSAPTAGTALVPGMFGIFAWLHRSGAGWHPEVPKGKNSSGSMSRQTGAVTPVRALGIRPPGEKPLAQVTHRARHLSCSWIGTAAFRWQAPAIQLWRGRHYLPSLPAAN
jgi:hypothetical protein